MAAKAEQTLGQLGQEATCPLCLDFFDQPMGLSCGHNFCRDCLAQLGTEFSCPQCRAKVEPGSACPSRALANIVCHLKRFQLSEGAHEESSGHRLCQEHGQPLQTFCSRERSLLCPGCLEGHQGHPLLSLPEAAQEYKDLLEGLLEPLREERQKLLEQKQAEEQIRQQCQEQFATEKQKVNLALESLQELHLVWLAWLAEQEEKMEAQWRVPLAQVSGEASRLQQLMAQLERKCRQPDGEFLQDIQDTIDRCQSYVVGRVESVSPRLQDLLQALLEKNASVRKIVDNYKASLQPALTRENLEQTLTTGNPLGFGGARRIQGRGLQKPPALISPHSSSFATAPGRTSPRTPASQTPGSKVYVELNGNTSHLRLLCQKTSVTWDDTYQDVPETPERFDKEFCVLGCAGFTTGQHWWEVSVLEEDKVPFCVKQRWAIGVARESVRRKGNFQLSPQQDIWSVGKNVWGEIVAFSKVPQKLNCQRPLRRLRVRLYYEAEQVEFLDAETEASLYTFFTGPFLGETLLPFFYLGHTEVEESRIFPPRLGKSPSSEDKEKRWSTWPPRSQLARTPKTVEEQRELSAEIVAG